MKYLVYFVFAVDLLLVSTNASGNDNQLFLKNGHQERFTDDNSLQWQDLRGNWNIDKQFVHPSGTEADFTDHQPVFACFPMVLNTKNRVCTVHFYQPPKNKFMSRTYLPPPFIS